MLLPGPARIQYFEAELILSQLESKRLEPQAAVRYTEALLTQLLAHARHAAVTPDDDLVGDTLADDLVARTSPILLCEVPLSSWTDEVADTCRTIALWAFLRKNPGLARRSVEMGIDYWQRRLRLEPGAWVYRERLVNIYGLLGELAHRHPEHLRALTGSLREGEAWLGEASRDDSKLIATANDVARRFRALLQSAQDSPDDVVE